MHFNYDVVMIPLQLIIVFFTIYYFVVSWFGLFGKMRETKQFPDKSTFALIVCAHNEQQVIAQLVDRIEIRKIDGYDITIHWRMTAEQFLGRKKEEST